MLAARLDKGDLACIDLMILCEWVYGEILFNMTQYWGREWVSGEIIFNMTQSFLQEWVSREISLNSTQYLFFCLGEFADILA